MKRSKPEDAPDRRYHHGSLRTALNEHGMRLLEQRSAEGLGLRQLAREVGVTPTAIYRHFPDKDALLRALAAEGLEKLGEAQAAAYQASGGGADGFTASGRAYVRFALKHPVLFRLILSFAPRNDLFAAPAEETSAPMRYLRDHIKAHAPENPSPDQLKVLALRAWSQVHGLAMLLLDAQIAPDDALIDAVVDGEGLVDNSSSHGRQL